METIASLGGTEADVCGTAGREAEPIAPTPKPLPKTPVYHAPQAPVSPGPVPPVTPVYHAPQTPVETTVPDVTPVDHGQEAPVEFVGLHGAYEESSTTPPNWADAAVLRTGVPFDWRWVDMGPRFIL